MNARSIVPVMLVCTVLAACAAPPVATREVPQPPPNLGSHIVLRVGQSVTLADAPVTLSFVAVSEDSRCPKRVNCVWSGQATISVQVQNGSSKTLALNTPEMPERPGTVTHDGYRIQLVDVQPYPETPDTPIKSEDYRVTFVVTRSA